MGFINPAAFWSATFIAGLVLLYLWERNQRRFDVPSLLLWDAVPEAVVRRSRFQPDFLFWLQLGVLSALMFGLANPYTSTSDAADRQKRSIIVLDLSASMQAAEGQLSRLEMAREIAVRNIRRMPVGHEAMLIAASRQPSVLVPFTDDHAALIERIGTAAAEDTSSNLEPALAIAQRAVQDSTRPTEVQVITDIPRDWIGDEWTEGADWWPVGSSDDNVAIESVEISQGLLQDHRHASALVTVRNFSKTEPTHGSLTMAFDGSPFSKQLFTISAGSESVFRIDSLPQAGLIEARLSDRDALPIDDRAFAWIRPFRPLRVALIGPDAAITSALAKLDAASGAVEVVAAATDEKVDPARVDVLIYHGAAPVGHPNTPSMTIAPAESSTAASDSSAATNVEVLDWNEQHPTLRGIDPRLLRPFQRVSFATPPTWTEAVLDSQANGRDLPILLAGEKDGVRHAIFNVDLARENLLSTDRETTLLLFLNVLDWLANRAQEMPVLRTGDSLPLPPETASSLSITDPRGAVIAQPRNEPASFLSLDVAGLYNVEGSSSLQHVIANFQDGTESDIGRPPPQPYTAPGIEIASEERVPSDGWMAWLLLVAACLLIAEWRASARTVEHG